MNRRLKESGDLPAVVHVSSAHPWTDNRIHYRECGSLARAGYPVTLVAVDADIEAPIHVERVITIPRLGRLKRFALSSARAIVLALRTGAPIVHLHDPELVWAIPLLRLSGRRVVFDAHEDLPSDALNKPYVSAWLQPAFSTLAHLVVWLSGHADHVIAATERISERYPARRTTVIHNYPPLREQEEEGGIERQNLAVYIGAMSGIRGTVTLVEASTQTSFPLDWKLALAGTATPDVASIVVEAATGENVEFYGQLPPDGARDLLLRAKVGLVTLHDTVAHRESLPTKMFEYFAAGLPVIASDFPLWREMLEVNDCGVAVDEESPIDIAEAIACYSEDHARWLRQSANARRLAMTELNWASEAEKLLAVYRELGA